MSALEAARWLHVVSATLLFGTGLGSAFYFLRANLTGDLQVIAFAARTVVLVDWLFVLPAVVLQPLSGGYLLWQMGYDPAAPWLLATYGLYLLAGACWLPAVWLQVRMVRLAAAAVASGSALPAVYRRCFRAWFLLGWPAFLAVLAIVWLMIARPV